MNAEGNADSKLEIGFAFRASIFGCALMGAEFSKWDKQRWCAAPAGGAERVTIPVEVNAIF